MLLVAACGGNDNNPGNAPQCSDGIDNDGDGKIDFPDDLGCASPDGSDESAYPAPQCSDGRDNDGDGKIDFPNDPGCFAPQQDTEFDDCPDGPNCPQCANGKDDDGNGLIDYPDDPGCTAASDTDELMDNPMACGGNLVALQLPFDGHVTTTIDPSQASVLTSPTCGGQGGEVVYELRISSPKVVVATTDLPGTTADTVLSVRSPDCQMELGCDDDFTDSSITGASQLAVSLSTPGVYFLVVDVHDGGAGGAIEMQVNLLAGEGELCDGNSSCGTGLVCRIPLNGTQKVCAKPVCSDGVDDDGDGKADFPEDPGCESADDNDETDDCPSGPNCPACSNGVDDDGDGKIDYPLDPQCLSASGASEVCLDKDNVATLTTATTMGDTTNAHNDITDETCSLDPNTAPDVIYRLDLPALTALTISTDPDFDAITQLVGSTCGGTPIGGASVGCEDTSDIVEGAMTAGTYYLIIDGWDDGSGTFSVTLQGTIKANGSCEGALAQSGALTCPSGYACAGTMGSRTCKPALCSDGMDNDGDGKIDYPFDPGCDSPGDNDETNAANTVCSDNMDNDGDGTKDFPADTGCASAADTSEVLCSTEHDAFAAITATTMSGTTAGKANDQTPKSGCTLSSNAPDVVYTLNLPVPVATLSIDTLASSYDTVLSIVDTHCTNTIACDDDDNIDATFSTKSKIVLTNVSAGNYAVVIDGYSTNSGTYTLTTVGTVAAGTACTAPGFSGANAYLKCPTGTTCTGGTCH
ncbi:MAG: hypothetical protein QM831_45545 [Kofleriaceae bacterium]